MGLLTGLSVVCYLPKKCNIDGKTCNCYFFEIDYENIRLMWVFKRFSVSTRPLTKVLIHFSVSQTQIVLDNNSFFHQNPRISDVGEQQKKLKLWNFLSIPIPKDPKIKGDIAWLIKMAHCQHLQLIKPAGGEARARATGRECLLLISSRYVIRSYYVLSVTQKNLLRK